MEIKRSVPYFTRTFIHVRNAIRVFTKKRNRKLKQKREYKINTLKDARSPSNNKINPKYVRKNRGQKMNIQINELDWLDPYTPTSIGNEVNTN